MWEIEEIERKFFAKSVPAIKKCKEHIKKFNILLKKLEKLLTKQND